MEGDIKLFSMQKNTQTQYYLIKQLPKCYFDTKFGRHLLPFIVRWV